MRPLLDAFFVWATEQYARVKGTRGLVAAAFGYAVRQEAALRRFLDDGRLPLTNNHSERALRGIAVGRNAWLFFGSDDHASAAANLFSLIASCELHGLDPEAYLAQIFRVLPYWPRERYLRARPQVLACYSRAHPRRATRRRDRRHHRSPYAALARAGGYALTEPPRLRASITTPASSRTGSVQDVRVRGRSAQGDRRRARLDGVRQGRPRDAERVRGHPVSSEPPRGSPCLCGTETDIRDVLNVPAVGAQVGRRPACQARIEHETDHAAVRSRAMMRPSTEAAAKARTCRMASSSSPGVVLAKRSSVRVLGQHLQNSSNADARSTHVRLPRKDLGSTAMRSKPTNVRMSSTLAGGSRGCHGPRRFSYWGRGSYRAR